MESILGQSVALRYARPSFDPVRGARTEFGYEGTEAALAGIIATLPSYFAWDLDNTNSPDCKLTIWIPDFSNEGESSTSYTLRYELGGNDIQKSIYEHPSCLALGESTILLIKQQVKKAAAHDETSAYVPSASLTGTAREFYSLINKGTDSYVVSQYVFKITQTVSSRWTSRVGFANIERIYSTATLANEANPPATMLFSLSQIDSYLRPATNPSGYAYGWLKKTPTVQQVAGNRFEITSEYWLETWSTLLYGALI